MIANLKALRSGTDLTESGMRLRAHPRRLNLRCSNAVVAIASRLMGKSRGLRADVLVIMARRFPIARLFGGRFREFDLQINHLNSLYVDAIQIFRIESIPLACRDMATHNRVHLLPLFLGQLVYQLQRVT